MGVVYYKYKSAKETYSVPLPYSFISVSELKQLILTSNRHGHGRTRGRGPREDIALSNAQTGEEYADENAMIPQNVTVLVRRVAGQMSENIVVFSSRKVIEDGSIASNKSVVTESASKSCSSTELQDEDAAIAAVIDAAELKWEDQSSKVGSAFGRFTSGRNNGHGPEREAPPPGYVCRSCGVPGHFIQHCPRENQTPPPGYTCFRCRIAGHFIHHCPTIGDPKFEDYRVSRSLAPVVPVNPVDGIPYALAPAASASAVDDLPAELHCRLCNKVMADAVLTSKCCFDSFCDKCIRDYIITQSKCICGVKVLADDLIPNHTLRSTISNMLATRAGSTASGTGRHKSSSGSNPDPKLQSPTTSAASGKDLKQRMDHKLPSASPDASVQVATEDDQVDQQKTKTEGSAGGSVEKTLPIAAPLKLNDVSESTLKGSTVSGTLEPKVAKPDQLKKKRKKADSNKIVRPNNADYGYNVPFDPAYGNPFNGGYPFVTDPYMCGPMGMPYGGYPMGPFGVDPFGNMLPFGNMPQQAPFGNTMPPQASFGNAMPPQALAMQGYPANHQSWEAHPAEHRDAEAAARLSSPLTGMLKLLHVRGRPRGQKTLILVPDHQSVASAWVLLTAQSPGAGPGQDRRGGTMDVLTELPMTTIPGQDRRGRTMDVLTELAMTMIPGQDWRGLTMVVLTELPMTTIPGQDQKGGIMYVLTELAVTTTRIKMIGRECAPLPQQMVTNRTGGGPDTVLGMWHGMIQATTSRISRGPGDADSQSPWTTQGHE